MIIAQNAAVFHPLSSRPSDTFQAPRRDGTSHLPRVREIMEKIGFFAGFSLSMAGGPPALLALCFMGGMQKHKA